MVLDMIESIQRAINYIEDNLTAELTSGDIAAQSHFSSFYFQRVFTALCGMTLFEYIRARRLTQAAQLLSKGELHVADAAFLYGYDSPDSFSRAFFRFHGIMPSHAKEKGVRLNAMPPLKLSANPEGGHIMEYRIVEKPAFTVVGVCEAFHPDTSYAEIPEFWLRHMKSPLADKIIGMYGVCLDIRTDDRFDYLIADNYIPWEEIPEGCIAHTIPAGTWAVFPCRGKLPEALQSVNTQIWREWLPSCREYKLAGSYNIEMYAPPAEKPEDNYCEIWVPLKKV